MTGLTQQKQRFSVVQSMAIFDPVSTVVQITDGLVPSDIRAMLDTPNLYLCITTLFYLYYCTYIGVITGNTISSFRELHNILMANCAALANYFLHQYNIRVDIFLSKVLEANSLLIFFRLLLELERWEHL